MNYYIVVEGEKTEFEIYNHWLSYASNLTPINSIDDFIHNNFLIVAGYGYPNYFKVIESGARDVFENSNIDRLVVAIDSEEMDCHDRYIEVDNFLKGLNLGIDYRIIVQHYCFETWALGNKAIVTRNPKDRLLKKFIDYYDVSKLDPEKMSSPEEYMNRSQFSELYMKKILNEKYRNLSYSKNNPKALIPKRYFERVKTRMLTTGHLNSFNSFFSAFDLKP